jgi:hypothetical protein
MPQNNRPGTSRIRLTEAINKLSQYFGLYTTQDLAGQIALTQIQGLDTNSSFTLPPPPPEVTRLIELLIDTSSGARTTRDLIRQLNQTMTEAQNSNNTGNGGTGSSVVERVNQLVSIYYGAGDTSNNQNADASAPVLKGSTNRPEHEIARIIGSTDTVNSNINNPNRYTSPGLGVILQNHIRVSPANKNVNACTIFLNGIPPLEMARSVPYLDIQFQFGRPPTDTNNRVQNASLEKFLFGATIAAPNEGTNGNRSITRLILDANTISGSNPSGDAQTYSTAGMELFTSPITLVNADEIDDPLLRSTPVLDKFRPFMTFKNLSIEVIPTTGIMCFKTAQMEFVLHDRSRLAEIADFIRPDLYSNTEILIEYGWNHPDPPGAKNYYADLINGMRCREKYGIVNVSFAMDELGQMNVNLHLAMRGATDMNTETIATDENGVGPILRQVADLSRTIGELRRRVFQQGAPGAREVRGIQILDAASDSGGQLLLTDELRNALRDFRRAMSNIQPQNPNVSNLLGALDRIYGPAQQNGAGGQIATLRSTVRNNIARKLARLSNNNDPFKPTTIGNPNIRQGRQMGRRIATGNDGSADLPGIPASCSLAKLLLLFIGEPLARTGKFDDVQLIFYPMNLYAGFASSLNIGQFLVDTRYFTQQYQQYRMQNASRAANVSLRDFLVFVAETIIDDPAAASYGLQDQRGAFYRNVRDNSTGNITTQTATNIPDSVALQTRIETLLHNRTPDGSFRLPQIDFYIECLPQTREAATDGESTDGSDSSSILRVHIFDRQVTSYDTQGALLQSNRDEELRTIGSLPVRSDGNPGVVQSQEESAMTVLAAAEQAQLIEQVPDTKPAIYRIRGGPRQLKDFLMKTSPYIIYGAAGTAVQTAGVSTIQDSQLSTVNLLRSFQGGPLEPNGENPGGMPLQVIPAEMGMQSWGCPLLEFAQQYFVDFQTGTTLDNYYTITGLSHKFEPGNFTTGIKFSFSDAYGKYSSLIDKIHSASDMLRSIQNDQNNSGTGQGNNTNSGQT